MRSDSSITQGSFTSGLACFFACLIISLSTVIPGVDFIIWLPPENLWFWFVLLAAVAGFYLLYVRVWLLIKIITVGMFTLCFFSRVLHESFSQYIVIVGGCYFYLMCTKIKDWTPVFNLLKTLLILNIFVIFMQTIRKDQLLNFAAPAGVLGIVGQHMQTASQLTIILAFLSVRNFWFLWGLFPLGWITHSSWTILNALFIFYFQFKKAWKIAAWVLGAVLLLTLQVHVEKIRANVTSHTGRGSVWYQSIKASLEYPWVGYGPASYKIIFPAIQRKDRPENKPYMTAHNFIVQWVFELGYLMTGTLLLSIYFLAEALYTRKLWGLLTALGVVLFNGLVHFPDRMAQTVPILIAFFAYLQVQLERYDAHTRRSKESPPPCA